VGIKKFAAIGFIVGAFLLVAIYAVKYIMSGVLHSGSELSERYGLPVYGEFAKSRARRPGKGLDKLFEKWEFKHASSEDVVVDEFVFQFEFFFFAVFVDEHRFQFTGTTGFETV
jgi:hypothetical protein